MPETFIVPVFGAPYPGRGAMVVPSGIAQAIPGRSHLAIHGQIGPSRHHHCPAHWAAEPPRVRKTSRTFLRSGVCGGESSKEHRDRVCPSRTRCEYIPVSSTLALPGQRRSWTGTPDPGARWVDSTAPGYCYRRTFRRSRAGRLAPFGRSGLGAQCPGLCEAGSRTQASRDGFTAGPGHWAPRPDRATECQGMRLSTLVAAGRRRDNPRHAGYLSE